MAAAVQWGKGGTDPVASSPIQDSCTDSHPKLEALYDTSADLCRAGLLAFSATTVARMRLPGVHDTSMPRGTLACLVAATAWWCSLLAVAAATDTTPPVQVQLRTPWHAPPLLYEILEAAHTEEPAAFFPLLSHLLDPNASSSSNGKFLSDTSSSSDRDIYEAAMRVMDEQSLLVEAGARSNWDLSLALHAESTKVVAFWQMYATVGLEARQGDESQGCGSWVDLAGQTICSAKELEQAAQAHSGDERQQPLPALTALDHTFLPHLSGSEDIPVAILYADPYSRNTWELHTQLMGLASKASPSLQYVLRWKPSTREGDRTLSGYGAALDLKKVDYLVIDDRRLVDTAAARHTDDPSAQQGDAPTDNQEREDRSWMDKQLKATDETSSQSMGTLAPEELSELGIKAAYNIAKSRNPLRALRQLAQNFPSHAVALARSAPKPSKSFIKEMSTLHMRQMEAGSDDVWVNGRLLSGREFQPFALIDNMRSERSIMNALTTLGTSPRECLALLKSKNISSIYMRNDADPPVFDASDRPERGDEDIGAITYWNDLEAENDPRYARWSPDLSSILRPMYPGSFPQIRRNLFNVILAMDLEQLSSVRFLSETVQMATSKVALRWGFVPTNLDDPDSASAKIAQYFWLAHSKLGAMTTSKFLRRVAYASQDTTVDVATAAKELDKILNVTSEEREQLLSDMGHTHREKARQWAKRLRASPGGPGHVFCNGYYVPFHSALVQTLNQLVMMQVQTLAAPIYYGQINEAKTDMSTYFYDLPTSYPSRSALLFPDGDAHTKTKAVTLSAVFEEAKKLLLPEAGDVGEKAVVWLIGDFDTPQGWRLIDWALADRKARTGFVHTGISIKEGRMSGALRSLAASGGSRTDTSLASLKITELRNMDDSGVAFERSDEYLSRAHKFQQYLGVPSDKFAVLVNGKLLWNIDPETLDSNDYTALIEDEIKRSEIVADAVSSRSGEQTIVASSIVNAAFFVNPEQEGFFTSPSNSRTDAFDTLQAYETAFSIGDPQTAKLHYSVLLNPLSDSAQKWSSTLQMLSHIEDVFIKVILNPSSNVTEIPVKRFYRFSSPHKLSFRSDGQVSGHTISFSDMPEDAVLTMGLDAPPTWLTMPEKAIYDLDNIRLRDAVTPTVKATYELKSILIEGHARDDVVRAIPRGLQLVLETLDGSTQLDTIVMANLAYFQFRAQPGFYRLRIREGRSAELYDMQSVGNLGWDSPPLDETGDYITLGNIQGLTIYPRVAKKKDRLRDRLVEDEEGDGRGGKIKIGQGSGEDTGGVASVLGRAQKALSSLASSPSLPITSTLSQKKSRHADINVFTVASGHLYERMTYIMVLSVLKHTKSTVKFWFIENFLSPSFKSFIPLLAQEYNFTYQLVTYAWPHWLRHQSEKQRSIWGMKVLFLDVLFPLDLSKVIFVDADQIVRADLKELVDTDLQGAPYGFPPMGNDSYDMDNFRFWESGYWENFLQGKPYPISALFVIDLNRFRLVAAGDKLRGHYQALSADPGSLSNLDQDLVASMIHTVPIHSLAKEWLWCETWCSWDWYDRAKSIDLCSNPKTHEPKLDRARRQIPEWTTIDNEVAAVARRLEEQGKLGANVVASSSNTGEAGKKTSNGDTDKRAADKSVHDEL